ncbi:MAG: ATP-dependent helicase, partial [Prevotella pectinovora]
MATKENKDKRKRKATGKKKAKVSHIIKPDNLSMEEWQVKLRRQIAEPAKLKIRCVDDELCPGEYLVDNPLTANEYKVVYRGANSEWNYCSCWDFKTSRLGTCKHIEAVKKWLGTRKEY